MNMENTGNKENKADLFTKLTLTFAVALLSLVTIASLVSAPFIKKKITDTVNGRKMEWAAQEGRKVSREADSLYSAGAISKPAYDKAMDYSAKAKSLQAKYAATKDESCVKKANAYADSAKLTILKAQMQKRPNFVGDRNFPGRKISIKY